MINPTTLSRIRMRNQKVSRGQRKYYQTHIIPVAADDEEGLVVNLTLHRQIIDLLVESGERGMTLNVSPCALVFTVSFHSSHRTSAVPSAISTGVLSNCSSNACIRIAHLRTWEIWALHMPPRIMGGNGATGTGPSHTIRLWSPRRAFRTGRMLTSTSRRREDS